MTTTFRMKDNGRLVTELQYRQEHDTIFPAVFSPTDADPILESPAPVVDSTHMAVKSGVKQDLRGNWVWDWDIVAKSQGEIDTQLINAKSAAIRSIDAAVDQIMVECVGRRETEYIRAEAQARAYKESGYVGQAKKSVHDWAVTKKWTDRQAADDIIAQADAWILAQETIREHRLQSKEDVRTATSSEQMTAAMASWSTFLGYIRNELGI